MSSEKEAFNVQNKFSRLYREEVLPALDQLFSHLVPSNEILRIPKMEIDLGRLEEGKAGAQFVEKCVSFIEKEVRKQLYLAKEGTGSHSTLMSREVSTVEQLIFFLQHGKMKWNVQPKSWNDFEFEAICALENPIANPTQMIKAVLRNKRSHRLRLIGQFSPQFIQRFLILLLKEEKPWIKALLLALEKIRKTALPKVLSSAFGEWLLEELLLPQEGASLSANSPLVIFAKRVQEKAGQEKAQEILIQLIHEIHKIPSKPMIEPLKQLIRQTQNGNTKGNPLSDPLPKAKREAQEFFLRKQGETEKDNSEAKELAKAGFMVGNAGLVLLLPFFKTLFQALNLLEKEVFKNTEAQQRAVLLSQYLVTGKAETPEYALTLNKFICGMPLNVPLDKFIPLSTEEKEEAHQLLEAVVKHWTALGKVSIESLQEGFLQRPGKLYLDQSKWRLLVERKSIDILVDRLPWTYSLAKLAWMQDVLHVEW